jgi:hypothetical protein
MAIGEALRAMAADEDATVVALTPPDRVLFRQFLRDALATADRPGPAVQRLVQFLVSRLPTDHPVRTAALADRTDLASTNDVGDALDQLQSLFEQLEGAPSAAVTEVATRARQRALAWPMRPVPQVDAAGDRADTACMIRLIDDAGNAHLPAFQFDRDGRPLRVVQVVNAILLADRDPWGAAFWWLTGNAWLVDPPADLLRCAPEADLIAAAQAVWSD